MLLIPPFRLLLLLVPMQYPPSHAQRRGVSWAESSLKESSIFGSRFHLAGFALYPTKEAENSTITGKKNSEQGARDDIQPAPKIS